MGGKGYLELAFGVCFLFVSYPASLLFESLLALFFFPPQPCRSTSKFRSQAHIRRDLFDHNSFYAPTHLAISQKEKEIKDEIALLGFPLTILPINDS